jgi:hypothetical protein
MTPEESEQKLRGIHADGQHQRQNPSCPICLLIQSLDRERELRRYAETHTAHFAVQFVGWTVV